MSDAILESHTISSYATVAVPIMPGLAQIPPPDQFTVTKLGNLNNWYVPYSRRSISVWVSTNDVARQVFNGESSVLPSDAWATVNEYYSLVEKNNLNSQVPAQYSSSLDEVLTNRYHMIDSTDIFQRIHFSWLHFTSKPCWCDDSR